MIEISRYFPPENPDFAGNPLVTFMPPLTPETLERLMSSPIVMDEAKRDHEAHLRIQYVMGLMDFFIPQAQHSDFAYNLWSHICNSLARRNPLAVDATQEFNDMCDSVLAGEPLPDSKASFLDSPWCVTLIGTPGSGKSSTVNALLRRFGTTVMHHKLHGALYQLVSVHIQPTKQQTGKRLAEQVYLTLVTAAESTGHYVPRISRPTTEAGYMYEIEVLARKLNLGVLVLDELQHLYRGTKGMDEQSMVFLTSLVNRLSIPVVLIGTWPCLALLGHEGRLARRGVSPVSAEFRKMKNDDEWFDFLATLFSVQYTRFPVKLTKHLANQFYEYTQGIQDLAVKLFVMCQMEAIADETETITPELVGRLGKERLTMLAPWLRHMRDGISETESFIYDAEPVDADTYLKEYAARAALKAAGTRKGPKRVRDSDSQLRKATQVAKALGAVGLNDDASVNVLAAAAVARAPGKTTAQHVASLLKDIRPSGPRPTKSASAAKKAKVHQAFAELESDDVRRIVFMALHEGQSAEAALQEAGVLCDPLEVPF
jgi:hypothetical protein